MSNQNTTKSVIPRILAFTKPYLVYLVCSLVCSIISVSLTLYSPVLIGQGIDLIIAPGNVNFGSLIPVLTMLAVVALCASLFHWLVSICTNLITYKTVRDLRVSVFARLEKVPLKYIDGHSHGDLISRIVNDVDSVSDGLLQGFSQLFTGIITIIATLGFMVYINFSIALVVVVITPLSLFVASFIAKKSFNMFRKQSAIRGEISGYIEEMVSNQKIIKAFSYEKHSQEKFEEINQRLYDYGIKSQFYSSLTNPSTRFVNGVVYAAVGIVGAITVINGGLTIGQLSSFLTYANQYTKPFNEITGVVTELQTALASARRIFAVIDEKEEASDTSNPVTVDNCSGKIDINDVSFSYNTDNKLIENLNVTAKPGQKIAIVGPTGCGKTTIINLLMRFYDVDSGDICVDNVPIKNMTRSNLRNLYGMVLQETWLFRGSVRDNIAYGNPNASDEDVIAAAKSAHAHSFIKRMPLGYNTILSEDGTNISQGQKQLLCIARVMLSKPDMLILDEATSSIDTRTEIKIQDAFSKMMQGHTSFIVAHRLSTIRGADLILVMKDGNIIEQGTHQQLLDKSGFYSKLYNSQFSK